LKDFGDYSMALSLEEELARRGKAKGTRRLCHEDEALIARTTDLATKQNRVSIEVQISEQLLALDPSS
jgi:hypothetical protein